MLRTRWVIPPQKAKPWDGWVNAVEYLYRRGAIDVEQVARAQRLANIGHLVAHTDMHMGNLSFLLSNDFKPLLSVAPAYDMAPMRWVPSSTTGVVPELVKEATPRVNDREALDIAREVWEVVANLDEVTPQWAEWAKDRARRRRIWMTHHCPPRCHRPVDCHHDDPGAGAAVRVVTGASEVADAGGAHRYPSNASPHDRSRLDGSRPGSTVPWCH
ncbi:hypothetical protein GCM10027066_34430 [Dyella jejuensis]